MKQLVAHIIFWLFIIFGFVAGNTVVAWTFITLYTLAIGLVQIGILFTLVISEDKVRELDIDDSKLNLTLKEKLLEPKEIAGLVSFLIAVAVVYSSGWTVFATSMMVNQIIVLAGALYSSERFRRIHLS